MNNYVGTYKGLEIYRITLDEFLNLPASEQNTNQKIHLITGDRYAITGGKIFGTITADNKRLDTVTATPWQAMYAVQLERKNELKKREEEKKHRAEAEAAAAAITERPTPESLVKETEKKLQEVKHVAENKVEDLHHEAEAKLAEVVEESGDAVQMVLETATEAATDMAAESKKVLNKVAAEGAEKAEAVAASKTTNTRRKRKTPLAE